MVHAMQRGQVFTVQKYCGVDSAEAERLRATGVVEQEHLAIRWIFL